MAVYQSLYVDEVAGSVDVNANTSKVRILWLSEQTFDSWNGYTRTAYYWVSINGGAETKYSVSYTLPLQTTQTIVDTIITVPHRDDGTGTVSVRTWMDTDISAGVVELSDSAAMTTIARASTIDAASNVTLGNACSVRWTPKSSAFRYKLKFSLGSWTYTTGAIHPNTTAVYTYTGYQIPMDAARQIPKSTGTMTVTLYTYSNSAATAQVGAADSKTFTVTVPDNADTKPTVTMALSPVSDLPAKFAGLYIQGKTKVKATKLQASGRYGATIASYSMQVDGVSYDESKEYTSEYLAKYGSVKVYGHATDTREFTGSTEQDIDVISYAPPKIVRATNETEVVAARCDKDGNLRDDGTYLLVKARRSYSKVTANGVQKNFCAIRYRWKPESGKYSEWVTILDSGASSDDVITGALLGGALAVDTTYLVQVGVIDDVGEAIHTTITVPSDKVYCHRDGARGSFTFGGYVEEDNTFAIASGFAFKPKGGIAEIAQYDYTNFDELMYATGYYTSSLAPNSAGCSNYPVNKTGVLEVISNMILLETGERWGFAWQTYRTYDGLVYMRSYYTDNGWTPWSKLTMELQ